MIREDLNRERKYAIWVKSILLKRNRKCQKLESTEEQEVSESAQVEWAGEKTGDCGSSQKA